MLNLNCVDCVNNRVNQFLFSNNGLIIKPVAVSTAILVAEMVSFVPFRPKSFFGKVITRDAFAVKNNRICAALIYRFYIFFLNTK